MDNLKLLAQFKKDVHEKLRTALGKDAKFGKFKDKYMSFLLQKTTYKNTKSYKETKRFIEYLKKTLDEFIDELPQEMQDSIVITKFLIPESREYMNTIADEASSDVIILDLLNLVLTKFLETIEYKDNPSVETFIKCETKMNIQTFLSDGMSYESREGFIEMYGADFVNNLSDEVINYIFDEIDARIKNLNILDKHFNADNYKIVFAYDCIDEIFRKKIDFRYKGNRRSNQSRPFIDNFYKYHIDDVINAIRKKFKVIKYKASHEADDIIVSLVEHYAKTGEFRKMYVYTDDKDAYITLKYPNVEIFKVTQDIQDIEMNVNTSKNSLDIQDDFEMTPTQYEIFSTLHGDSSDNVFPIFNEYFSTLVATSASNLCELLYALDELAVYNNIDIYSFKEKYRTESLEDMNDDVKAYFKTPCKCDPEKMGRDSTLTTTCSNTLDYATMTVYKDSENTKLDIERFIKDALINALLINLRVIPFEEIEDYDEAKHGTRSNR